MTRLSIAMCTYNGARYLRDQLQSIAVQTRIPNELVVFDDKSNDETVRLLEAFAKQAGFEVRLYVSDVNVGATKNFERTIQLCRGNLIFLADQDDVWHPRKLEEMEGVFSQSRQIGAVFTDAELINDRTMTIGKRLWRVKRFGALERRQMAKGNPLRVLLKHNVVTGATMAFRSEYRGLVTPIPETWAHDAWISLLVAAVCTLVPLDKPLMSYRLHPFQAVGDHRISFHERVRAADMARKTDFANVASTYQLAHERLLGSAARYSTPVSSLIKDKVQHYGARAAMPRQLAHRMPSVMRELLTLRYRQYSSGVWSAAKDLLVGSREYPDGDPPAPK